MLEKVDPCLFEMIRTSNFGDLIKDAEAGSSSILADLHGQPGVDAHSPLGWWKGAGTQVVKLRKKLLMQTDHGQPCLDVIVQVRSIPFAEKRLKST